MNITQTTLFFVFLFTVHFLGLPLGFAQQQDIEGPTTIKEAAPDNIPSTNGTDLLASGGAASVAIGGVAAAFLKDRKDKKDVINKFGDEFKVYSENQNELNALRMKLDNYGYVYKNYTYSQLLDLPAYNSPLDKTTIGQAITVQTNKIVKKAQSDYNVPLPQMAIASQSIVAAAQNNTTPPATQDPKTAATPIATTKTTPAAT